MKLYFGDNPFDGQLQRSVGKADSGMANVGECLAIAEQITPGDRDSWYRAWSGFASRLINQADQAAKGGHRVSARGAYLRAAEYFRQAFFFHRENLNGSKLQSAYAASVQAFRSAQSYLSHPGRILSGAVSGYLFAPSHTDGRCPTILHIGGYDGIAEEGYASAPAALERGYVFAVLDGPGQGAMLYDRRVPMRPDWENVVPAMFDAVTANPEVDPDRVVLVGRSFGGLIAPRGAAGEHRLAAMIVDPGQYDLGTAFAARLGPLMDRVNDPAADPQFDALLDNPAMKALLEPRMATHGVSSVRAYCADILRYTNAATVARVVCPTFVTDNETDEVSTGQGRILFNHLTCPKEFRLFTKAEGAEGHCEGMAPIVFWDAAYNWLDSILPPGPAKTPA
jgi:Alpha/beta hydrolase family